MDASLIAAPNSTKNEGGSHELELHETGQDPQWHVGIKLHMGVDTASGLMHTLRTTPAHLHNLTQSSHLWHGEKRQSGEMPATWGALRELAVVGRLRWVK